MHTNQDKIKRSAQLLQTIFQLAQLFMIVLIFAGILSLIIAVFIGKVPSFQIDTMSLTGDLGLFSVGNSDNSLIFREFIVKTMLSLFALGFLFIIFRITTQLFRNLLAAESPFLLETGKKLRQISFWLLILALPFPFLSGILSIFVSQNGTVSVSLKGIVLSLIIYSLALVFDEGQILQSQADETL